MAGEGKIWDLEIETWTLRVAMCLTLLNLDVLWLIRAQYKEFLDAFLSIPSTKMSDFLKLQEERRKLAEGLLLHHSRQAGRG